MTEFTDDEKALIDATQWPKTEEDATADALIVHGARLALAMRAKTDVLMREAFSIDRDSPEYKTAISAYMDSITSSGHHLVDAEELDNRSAERRGVMGLYPMSGCANCGAHESRITCRCWCHDPKPSSGDPS